MRRPLTSLLGLIALTCSAGLGHAACTQLEIEGTWQVYGTYADGIAAASGRCVLKFNSVGVLASTSKCSFRDETLGANVTIGVVGSLLLRNAQNCVYEGNIAIAGGTYKNKSAALSAGLSRDKTILMATGTIVNGPGGAISFTAMKP